ncbi:DUF4381 domain-containing protein [Zavarzinella formosa]|uniref:DUF4381 domain-containing protein n=1 Tax=Zavarzinella formosa TaxID=360055 RepID=UPI0002E68FE7|nr:DUF4381 domain-containing protein [Zavarzinella formosa]
MPDQDPGSLDRLHDIAMPPPAPWWPPTPGWITLAAFLFALLLLGLAMLVLQRHRNRYRREALAELDRLGQTPDPAALAELLKRVALAAYAREKVASLTGTAWLTFLDETGRHPLFKDGPGKRLEESAFQSPTGTKLTDEDRRQMVGAVRDWITHHRC